MTKSKYIIFAVCAVIVIATLFIPPFFGKGDDGSLYGILLENGLYNAEGADTSFFNGTYGISPSVPENGFSPITVAKALCAFVSTTVFDIRFLAILYLPVYLAGVFLIIRSIKIKHLVAETVICAIAAIILCDIGYISYINSLYHEALYLSFFLLLAGSIMNIMKEDRLCPACAVLSLISAAVLACKGVDGALIGIFTGIALIAFPIINKKKSLPSFICGGLSVILSFILIFAANNQSSTPMELYGRVISGTLFETQTPEQDMEALGINSKYASYSGISYYDALKEEGTLNPGFAEELKKVDQSDALAFYVKKPSRFMSVISSAGKNAPFLTQSYISTKQNTYYSIKMAPSLWSYCRRFLTPGSAMIVFAVAFAVFVLSFFISKKDSKTALGGIATSVASMAFFISPILRCGLMNISRNLVLHQAALDLMIILIICYAVNLSLTKRQELKDKYGVNQ